MPRHVNHHAFENRQAHWAKAPPATTWPGRPAPLGACFDGNGTNFSLFSEVAEAVDLCLFDEHGRERRVRMPEVNAYCWHVYLPNVRPGQRYGFRVHGPWDPASGRRCNPHKLLMDPCAKAFEGQVDWSPACFDHDQNHPDRMNEDDSAGHVPRSVVHEARFDWGDDRPPAVPLHKTLIYEVHVKGFTKRHPAIDPVRRGTYLGLADDAAIEHLVKLGVTTIELMPVHQFIQDGHLVDKNLRNYWGYNTIGFFAPHNEYASGQLGQQVTEFKHMVKRLHAAGLEVILDVVYNHTAEGNHQGPSLCFKGIDNAAYYRLVPEDRRYYFDTTGTGNSLNMRSPHALQLIMDSLRYWVTEMHVDGFRFDLASTLARELHHVDRLASFFDLVQQDPIISQVKLIAEPWDVGEGGYQVGNFPAYWSEWNGQYRDTMRDFWRGHAPPGGFANRLTGSPDFYQADARRPMASINFITAHDGFTLRDLVSYNDKHNQANGEDSRDGDSHNRSWNCGAEGKTDKPEVLALRARQQRNLMATLLLSQGVPMILGGDELGRTQNGNNNAYCQDNEISWFDWTLDEGQQRFLEFVRDVIALRQHHPVFTRRRWFQGQSILGVPDVAWYRPDGQDMTEDDWHKHDFSAVGVFLSGDALPSPDDRGRKILDDSFLLIFNAHHEDIDWCLPDRHVKAWTLALDTARPIANDAKALRQSSIDIKARSVLVLRAEV